MTSNEQERFAQEIALHTIGELVIFTGPKGQMDSSVDRWIATSRNLAKLWVSKAPPTSNLERAVGALQEAGVDEESIASSLQEAAEQEMPETPIRRKPGRPARQ